MGFSWVLKSRHDSTSTYRDTASFSALAQARDENLPVGDGFNQLATLDVFGYFNIQTCL